VSNQPIGAIDARCSTIRRAPIRRGARDSSILIYRTVPLINHDDYDNPKVRAALPRSRSRRESSPRAIRRSARRSIPVSSGRSRPLDRHARMKNRTRSLREAIESDQRDAISCEILEWWNEISKLETRSRELTFSFFFDRDFRNDL